MNTEVVTYEQLLRFAFRWSFRHKLLVTLGAFLTALIWCARLLPSAPAREIALEPTVITQYVRVVVTETQFVDRPIVQWFKNDYTIPAWKSEDLVITTNVWFTNAIMTAKDLCITNLQVGGSVTNWAVMFHATNDIVWAAANTNWLLR